MNVDLSWMDRIACAGMDPALFFARAGKSEVAELVCVRCPVREQCGAWAGDATVGVWGGETRKRKPAAPKPAALETKGESHEESADPFLAHQFRHLRTGPHPGLAARPQEPPAPKRKPRLNVAVDIVDGPNGIELVPRTTRNERGAA